MKFFGGKKQETFHGMLGVDIGPSGVKIVELAPEKGRMRLSTYGYSEFAQPRPEPMAFLENAEKTADALTRIVKDSGMRATKAVAALPSAMVFQAIITIPQPKNTKDDLKATIETQAAKLLPLPIGEMIVDSSVLDKELLQKDGETPKDAAAIPDDGRKNKNIRVLVTAAPKTLVEKYVEIFRKAKIELVSLETEVFALIRSLVGNDKSRIMLVDMGHVQTNIAIIDRGVPHLHRSTRGGGVDVTNALAQSTSMAFADAERMKCDLGLQSNDGTPPKVVQTALENIVHELRYAIELYAQQDFHTNTTVEKIIVTGGSAHLPALDAYLTSQLHVNVYIGDPWARVAAPPTLRPVLEEVGPRFSVALGLAMRSNEA